MTASAIKDQKISEFTLALLEGSGWYQVNYDMAEVITWGKNKGCDFLETPCFNKDTQTAKFEEFCSRIQGEGCSYTGRGWSVCGSQTIQTSASLPGYLDHWGNKTRVSDIFGDNCPMYNMYSNTDCEDPDNQVKAFLGTKEYYGRNSMCFEGK